MGTFGPDLFDDDVAMDVRDDFLAMLERGATVESATFTILEEFAHGLQDIDDRPTIWLALAALQLEQGQLQSMVRLQAFRLIEDGSAIQRWMDLPSADVVERQDVLQAFKEQLSASGAEHDKRNH